MVVNDLNRKYSIKHVENIYHINLLKITYNMKNFNHKFFIFYLLI